MFSLPCAPALSADVCRPPPTDPNPHRPPARVPLASFPPPQAFGLLLAFVYDWRMALVVAGCLPLIGARAAAAICGGAGWGAAQHLSSNP